MLMNKTNHSIYNSITCSDLTHKFTVQSGNTSPTKQWQKQNNPGGALICWNYCDSCACFVSLTAPYEFHHSAFMIMIIATPRYTDEMPRKAYAGDYIPWLPLVLALTPLTMKIIRRHAAVKQCERATFNLTSECSETNPTCPASHCLASNVNEGQRTRHR